MIKHKHCYLCGSIIIPSSEDNFILDKERFKRDIAYNNGFCEQCMAGIGLDRLCKWRHGEITYFKMMEWEEKS